MPLSQEERFDMNEQASYFINKPLHSHREIFDIDIPNYVSIGEIVGRNGRHIEEVKRRFNAIILIKNDISPPFMKIILKREDSITPIRRYYNKFFDECKKRTIIIPNKVPVGVIIGKNGKNIEKVKNKFNTQIHINQDSLFRNVIKIINNEQNLDEINQYYEEFFDRFILRTS